MPTKVKISIPRSHSYKIPKIKSSLFFQNSYSSQQQTITLKYIHSLKAPHYVHCYIPLLSHHPLSLCFHPCIQGQHTRPYMNWLLLPFWHDLINLTLILTVFQPHLTLCCSSNTPSVLHLQCLLPEVSPFFSNVTYQKEIYRILCHLNISAPFPMQVI